MRTDAITRSTQGSFLLELLHYAGWRLEIRGGEGVRIRAVRDGVEVRGDGASLAEAAGEIFAHAMRSRRTASRSRAA